MERFTEVSQIVRMDSKSQGIRDQRKGKVKISPGLDWNKIF